MSPEGVRPFHSRFAASWPRARGRIHPRSAVGRALRMAQGIQARSAGLAGRIGRLPMTLLSRPITPPAAAGTVRVEVNVNLGEGAAVKPVFAPPLMRPNPNGAAETLPPAPARSRDHPLMELARPLLPASGSGLVNVLERLMQQHERIETAVRYTPTGPAGLKPSSARLIPAASPGLQQPPTRQVVRRTVPATEQPEAIPDSPALATRGRPAEPAQPSAPPLDINRLTDQVIQAIDRRIIASRERRGRI